MIIYIFIKLVYNIRVRKSRHIITGSLLAFSVLVVSACGSTTDNARHSAAPSSAGISGVFSVDAIATRAGNIGTRSAALLGIFVSEYVSVAPTALAAEGGLKGIGVQMQIAIAQHTVQDPDFDLLQAFADALQVDVPDMLNRSTDRQQTLDTYRDALTNVASRSNDRFKELSTSLTDLKAQLRDLGKKKSDADRALKTALKNKDFADAGEKQKAVNETQSAFAETDLKRKQVEDLLSTLGKLLTLYGEKIQAINANREVLISGAKVVDVPGIDELDILKKQSTTRPSNSKGGATFDQLFQSSGL